MVNIRFPLRNFLRARSAWLGVGAPIVALVVIVIALSFAVVSGFARQQDRDFVENSQRLVENALRERQRALENIAVDFAVWNDAYAATTAAWNSRWLESNYYSNVADGLYVIAANGTQRFDWVAEPFLPQRAAISEAVGRAVSATDLTALSQRAAKGHVAYASFVTVDGQPAIVALAQIAPEGLPRPAQRPVNFLAVVDVLSSAELAGLGASLELRDLGFNTGVAAAQPHNVAFGIESMDGASLGALTWRREQPGRDAFAGQVWPIVLGLIVIGALTLLVARRLTATHVAARVQAEAEREASRLKSEFIATMSHELRTPLNVVMGYTELIQEQSETLGGAGADIHEDAAHVLDAARRLGRLVNDILDQSRIDAGRLQLANEAVEVTEIFAELEELMTPLAQANLNSFSVVVESNVGAVKADPVRLQQCLVNLTSNALKFTRAGSVRVSARRLEQDGQPMTVFEVRDTGDGMTQEALERLFRPFPAPEAGGNFTDGVGLSLSITRSLARLMGGEVTARSAPGQGSTFILTLPAAALAAESAA